MGSSLHISKGDRHACLGMPTCVVTRFCILEPSFHCSRGDTAVAVRAARQSPAILRAVRERQTRERRAFREADRNAPDLPHSGDLQICQTTASPVASAARTDVDIDGIPGVLTLNVRLARRNTCCAHGPPPGWTRMGTFSCIPRPSSPQGSSRACRRRRRMRVVAEAAASAAASCDRYKIGSER
ncbi:hypothetical protein BD414DRAFT_471904 [Trametes punicea]|nr:hypothetical protein BD414DRAFT_471904 [Trametes punicea]